MADENSSPSTDLAITDLRGGMWDTDPPSALPENKVVLAENVEFFTSTLGERRNGCGSITITGSGLTDEAGIGHLSQWFPTNDVLDPEWFAVGVTPLVSATIAKRTNGIWTEVPPKDALNLTAPDVYEIATQSLNGKDFWAYHSTEDRLHVWDGTTLRRTGFAEPAAPTVANEGAGTYAGIRYFRVRYVARSGSTILRRSEPSLSVALTPSGAGKGARITKPATVNEGETDWEVEASDDNATFYRIATVAVGTSTYDDETTLATSYAVNGTLSEAIGTYLNLPSARFLIVDGDRLIGGGHWTDLTRQSQVFWSPVKNDPGFGNDERLPLGVNNTNNLDNFDGGPLTGLGAGANGTWYAFKWEAIYKATRTGDVNRAYDFLTLSKRIGQVPGRGAITGSIVGGLDDRGASCLYFLDPNQGPSRLGSGGLETVEGLRTTWGRVSLQAAYVVARAAYYPYKNQVHWWVAVDGSDQPALKIVLQDGKAWSIATGRITQARAVGVFTELVSIDGVQSISNRPVVGLSAPDYLQRCDTESTDAGVAYRAIIRTRPYIVTGLLNKWGAMVAALLANANATASLVVKFIRDFGLETNQVSTTLVATSSEELVIKIFDDLVMSEATTIQVEFSDP